MNPLVDFALSATGTLTFRNVAADTHRAPAAESYEVQWARFDNHTGSTTPEGEPQGMTTLEARAPASLLNGDFVEARVSAKSPLHPAWADPVTVRFRRGQAGWSLVGVRRGPDPASQEPSR